MLTAELSFSIHFCSNSHLCRLYWLSYRPGFISDAEIIFRDSIKRLDEKGCNFMSLFEHYGQYLFVILSMEIEHLCLINWPYIILYGFSFSTGVQAYVIKVGLLAKNFSSIATAGTDYQEGRNVEYSHLIGCFN